MSSSEAIGGYFGLELSKRSMYHKNAIGVNSGRNAFEYILRARKYRHVYIPFYTCDVLLEPLKKLNIAYDFYAVNDRLEPVSLDGINFSSGFLYTNYFGLKSTFIKELAGILPNLIIDAAQAFFHEPIGGVDTFYSPRKFFGVPDGGYVISDQKVADEFAVDISINRFTHLLARIDKSAEEGFADFKADELTLCNQPIKQMSKVTHSLLNNIDYQGALKKRNENFSHLHSFLKAVNGLKWLGDVSLDGPMIYPFYTTNLTLRKKLIDHKIYVASYWPNVREWVSKTSLEYQMYEYLIPLPIDQRYGQQDMKFIIEKILE
jgi:hypothetical protein